MRAMTTLFGLAFVLPVALAPLEAGAQTDRMTLLTGTDARLYPGANRTVVPSSFPTSGIPGTFNDGDRLAGTADRGPLVNYVGNPPDPLFQPNEFGSLSFLFRRGSVPAGPAGRIPLLGIEFLGGPLLDLDGDLDNGVRSLIPVSGQTAVAIPGSSSHIELEFDVAAGVVHLVGFDATGTNEGGPGTGPEIATVVVTLAGTTPSGTGGPAINPAIDTRTGQLTLYAGLSGALSGVYRISSLGYELWEDTLLDSPTTGPLLGTLQFLGSFDGWLVQRAPDGSWPTLAGEGLGPTLWPEVDTSQVGETFLTAQGAAGGFATITRGPSGDDFAFPGNGGLPLTDFGGDLGAYLDNVALPAAPAAARRVVYLEAAGFGINNSFDPVFLDTIGYDAVILAAGGRCDFGARCDANCDGQVDFDDIDCFVAALVSTAAWSACVDGAACDFVCANDADGDGRVDFNDIDGFVGCLVGR